MLVVISVWFIVIQLKKLRIGHDGTGPGAGWFLDEIVVDIPSKGEKYTFACHRWLDKKENDGQIEIEMEPTSVEKGAMRNYLFTVRLCKQCCGRQS